MVDTLKIMSKIYLHQTGKKNFIKLKKIHKSLELKVLLGIVRMDKKKFRRVGRKLQEVTWMLFIAYNMTNLSRVVTK